jgi:hypothetical protein
MKPELTPASVALLCLVFGLLAYDWATARGRGRPALALQAVVFVSGGVLIVFPGLATRMAHAVGIGRGVDFVLYPLVIWLARESLVTRRRRYADEKKLAQAVRALAIATAHPAGGLGEEREKQEDQGGQEGKRGLARPPLSTS